MAETREVLALLKRGVAYTVQRAAEQAWEALIQIIAPSRLALAQVTLWGLIFLTCEMVLIMQLFQPHMDLVEVK